MGWTQQVEYVDHVELWPPTPVKKQVWDGEKFVGVVQYRLPFVPTQQQQDWLTATFGRRRARWDYSVTGNFTVMDEQVYAWFQIKWGNK